MARLRGDYGVVAGVLQAARLLRISLDAGGHDSGLKLHGTLLSGKWQSEIGDGKWEMGDRRWEVGNRNGGLSSSRTTPECSPVLESAAGSRRHLKVPGYIHAS